VIVLELRSDLYVEALELVRVELRRTLKKCVAPTREVVPV
jgi:hypothetical protein